MGQVEMNLIGGLRNSFGQGKTSMKLRSLECILGNFERFKGIMSAFSLKPFKSDCFEHQGNIFAHDRVIGRPWSEVQTHFQDYYL